MKYSVSATCLRQEAFEDNVLALLAYPVTELHCDYFPEIDTAPSLSFGQLSWCLEHWPRGLTVHLWGDSDIELLPPPSERRRLLIQLHDDSDEQIEVARGAARNGWATGVSLCPHLVGSVMPRIGFAPAAVQVLTTSTPGFPGGSFLASTWTVLDELRGLRRALDAGWTIEVDGGLTDAVMARLADRCDLAVIGSNYLREHAVTGHRVPDRLLEAACLSSFTS